MRLDKAAPLLAGVSGVVADGIVQPKDLDVTSPCKSKRGDGSSYVLTMIETPFAT